MAPIFLKLAVVGDPVAHSASPELQRGFLAEAGLAGSYEAIRIAAGNGARGIEDLRAAGYTGLNVTTPLKEEAFASVDWVDAAARAARAVNTIVFSPTHARGYNTDGIGAIGALAGAGLARPAGFRVLVLGAGPTARATVVALVAAGARAIVWNRTVERARHLSATLGAELFDRSAHRAVDAVFSTLSPGVVFEDEILRQAVAAAPIVIDANYANRSTLSAALGRDVTTGIAMLGASARASFELFRSAETHARVRRGET